jgi:uncharacterized OB-fold protein
MSELKCKKCGSSKIIEDARITDFSHGNVEKNPSVYFQKTNRAFFNKHEQGELIAQICGNCGNVELTISNAPALYEAYMRSKSS